MQQHKPYPSYRYHPELPARIVHDDEQSAALGRDWRDTPYPVKPLPTREELAAANRELVTKIVELSRELGQLKTELEQARKIIAGSLGSLEGAAEMQPAKAQAMGGRK